MKFLGLPIFLMFFLSLISIAYVSSSIVSAYDGSGSYDVDTSDYDGFGWSAGENGSTTDYTAESVSTITVATAMTYAGGMLAAVIAMIALSAVIGIQAVGSGLGEYSVRTVVLGTTAMVIWAFFSAAALVALVGGNVMGVAVEGLPYGLGYLIYFGLSMVYAFGVLDIVGRG